MYEVEENNCETRVEVLGEAYILQEASKQTMFRALCIMLQVMYTDIQKDLLTKNQPEHYRENNCCQIIRIEGSRILNLNGRPDCNREPLA